MTGIIVLTGPIKSGKTTLSRLLADALRVPLASFGRYIRSKAQRRGIPPDSREQLQQLGLQLVSGDVQLLCRGVLNDVGFVSGKDLVIEGVRHVSVLTTIKDIAPGQIIRLVYLESSVEDRAKRAGISVEQMRILDSHPVEREIPILKSMADLVMDTSAPAESTFHQLHQWVRLTCPPFVVQG